jgi:hypothetical protein
VSFGQGSPTVPRTGETYDRAGAATSRKSTDATVGSARFSAIKDLVTKPLSSTQTGLATSSLIDYN